MITEATIATRLALTGMVPVVHDDPEKQKLQASRKDFCNFCFSGSSCTTGTVPVSARRAAIVASVITQRDPPLAGAKGGSRSVITEATIAARLALTGM